MLRRRNTRAYSWVTVALLMALWLSVFTYRALSAGDRNIPPVEFTTLDGGEMALAELAQGRWALGFVILPGCPACEQVIDWFAQAARAFPELRFLLVTPQATPQLVALMEEQAAGLQVLLDQDGVLGATLEVERAPTVFLLADGVHVDRLDWPFTEEEFLLTLEESLHVEFEVPDTTELLGQPAPDFTALDLAGTEIALADLPRSLLLSFFNPDCPPCWEALPALASVSEEVAVALVVIVAEPPLPAAHRERLNEQLGGSSVRVLLVEGFDLLDTYKVAVTPTTILIDEQEMITWIREGHIDEQSLRSYLRTLEGS